MVEFFAAVQRQMNSLASVALQDRRALDLLTTEKQGTCLFLGELYCSFVSETGIVQGKVRELRDRIRRVIKSFDSPQPVPTGPPVVTPFLGAISTFIWTCFFSLLQSFLQDQIQAISQDQVKAILLESLTSTLEK